MDIFPTATTKMAHLVLPATPFAESDGTFTNSVLDPLIKTPEYKVCVVNLKKVA